MSNEQTQATAATEDKNLIYGHLLIHSNTVIEFNVVDEETGPMYKLIVEGSPNGEGVMCGVFGHSNVPPPDPMQLMMLKDMATGLSGFILTHRVGKIAEKLACDDPRHRLTVEDKRTAEERFLDNVPEGAFVAHAGKDVPVM